jgi:hypothetical protein
MAVSGSKVEFHVSGKITVFCDVTPCGFVYGYQLFGGTVRCLFLPHLPHVREFTSLGHILDASKNCKAATISFVMAVCLSVRPSVFVEQLGFHWTDFNEFDIRVFFENLPRKFKFH